MATPRANRFRGTLAPSAGASPARRSGQETYREVPLWPGVTWGRTSECSCSWSYRGGKPEVKVLSGACLVHIGGRQPETPPTREDSPTVEEMLARLIALIAEVLEDDVCGSHTGYNRHVDEGTPVCAECAEAERTYSRERKRAAARAAREMQAAA